MKSSQKRKKKNQDLNDGQTKKKTTFDIPNSYDKRHVETMLEYYITVAKNGNSSTNATAAFYLGKFYETERNEELMLKYYKMAADAGNLKGIFNLGLFYHKEKNNELMLKYYKMAIDAGDLGAMNNLGLFYHEEKNNELMMKYYKMAIDAGNSRAMNNLGFFYYKTERNEESMLKYFNMAIDAGLPMAMYNLGLFYKEKNKEELMLKYYKMAIDAGKRDPDVLCTVAKYYAKQNDTKMASKYYIMVNDENGIASKRKLFKYYRKNLSTSFLNSLGLYHRFIYSLHGYNYFNNVEISKLLIYKKYGVYPSFLSDWYFFQINLSKFKLPLDIVRYICKFYE